LKNNQIIMIFILFTVAFSIFSFSFMFSNYNTVDLDNILKPAFSGNHLLGTDQFGRDLFARNIQAVYISVFIGFVASVVSAFIGIFFGLISGYFKSFDNIVMRFVEIVQSFPTLLILIALISIFDPTIKLTILVIGLVSWPSITRIVRGQVLKIRTEQFVIAAQAMGYSDFRVLTHHIFLNCLSPLIIIFTLNISSSMMFEAGLSFLGLGVQPPTPSLGRMINEGKDFILSSPKLFMIPSVMLAIIIIFFNTLGEKLREVLEVKK
tara:strand:+ start:569 stop:1363 length:795 start_codon:yes stop_codon:yes gene_type:complete